MSLYLFLYMFKRIAAAFAACALTVTPGEAVTRNEFVARLKQIGVNLVHHPTCQPAGLEPVFGMYNPSTNTMCINSELFAPGQEALWDETVTHEAVHVMQDCINGFDEETLVSFLDYALENDHDTTKLREYMTKNLSPDYYEFINAIEDGHIRDAEIEAYALESDPQLVYEMMESVCLER